MANIAGPNGGAGFVGGQQPVQMNGMNQQMSPMLTPTSYTLMIVNRYDEAANAWVPPGYTTIFVNFNDHQMYVKKNDNGIPSQVRVFDFTERIVQPQQTNQNGVTREEFDEFKATLLAAINSAKQQNEDSYESETQHRDYPNKRYQKGGKR